MALPLALTLGEPAGIGPDITFAAWRRRAELGLTPFYLLADPTFVARRTKRIAPDVPIAVVEPAAAWASFKSAPASGPHRELKRRADRLTILAKIWILCRKRLILRNIK